MLNPLPQLNQNGGSRTDTLIKLVLIFFISLLSFSVGTFVGKKFSDTKHKMSQLESEYDSTGVRDTASIPDSATEVKPEDALTEKDIQKIAEEFSKPEGETHPDSASKEERPDAEPTPDTETTREVASEQKTAPAQGGLIFKAPTPAPAAPTAAAPAAPTMPAQAAERIAHGQAPSENKPPAPNPLPQNLPVDVANTSIGKYTVQISSHQTDDEAREYATKLKQKGFSAFVVPATVKGKTWYRVSVGLFDKRDEAKNYQDRLIKEAGVASAFIQQITK